MERNKQSSLNHKPYCCVSITIVLSAESLVSTAAFHIKLWVLCVIGAEVRAKGTKLTETIIPSKGKDSTASSTLDLLLVWFALFLSIIDRVCVCVYKHTCFSV